MLGSVGARGASFEDEWRAALAKPIPTNDIAGPWAGDWTSKSNGERTENQYHIRELSYGSFKRQLRLPENIEGDPVAELKDGILTLTFKLQLPEEKKPEVRHIPIQKS